MSAFEEVLAHRGAPEWDKQLLRDIARVNGADEAESFAAEMLRRYRGTWDFRVAWADFKAVMRAPVERLARRLRILP